MKLAREQRLGQSQLIEEILKPCIDYKTTTHFITGQTNFVELIHEHFPDINHSLSSICLTGLHTCGNLAPSCLRIFTDNHQISTICNVGCCYNLLNERFKSPHDTEVWKARLEPDADPDRGIYAYLEGIDNEVGFPMSQHLTDQGFSLGRNARMLSVQSIHRFVDEKEFPLDNLFYRAVLEVLIVRKWPELKERIRVGRIKKCQSFVEFVRKCAVKNSHLDVAAVTDDELVGIFKEFSVEAGFMVLFQLMRISIAHVIESVILIDRLLYLKEINRFEATLVRLFDPVVSPRCYGIVSLK